MDIVTIRSLVRANRALSALVVAMLVLSVVCLVGVAVDPRVLGGQPVWLKPLKFAISFVLYGATLAWMIPMVTGPAARRWAGRMGVVVAVMAFVEMVAITGQAARGRASHFAVGTPFDTLVWAVMGAAITVLWVATAVVAILLLTERSLPRPLAAAVRAGLGIALLGMAAASLMLVPRPDQLDDDRTTVGAHTVGAPDGGPGLPLVGWSTTDGDLRIGHFVGMHALQALPLLAFALAALAGALPILRDERIRAALVRVAGAAWTGLTLLLVWQALRGQSIVATDALTLIALGALGAMTVLAAAGVLATGSRAAPATDRAGGR